MGMPVGVQTGWGPLDSGGIRTKSIKEAREHVHITGEVVPQPTDRSADR